MPLKDMAMSATQQEEFHVLLLKGTVSGNLPFSWIDNEYIQAAFATARPTAVLPSRRALSGLLCALLSSFVIQCCCIPEVLCSEQQSSGLYHGALLNCMSFTCACI